MIPGGDHSSRTLLLRQVSSYSDVAATPTHTRAPSSSSFVFDSSTPNGATTTNNSNYNNNASEDYFASSSASITLSLPDDLSRPLLPSLEYEEESRNSSSSSSTSSRRRHHDSNRQEGSRSTQWKLWLGFVVLVVTGVGNVIFSKLQALPMYNYPTFLNMYANLLYILMSFAYIIPVSLFGWFESSIPMSHMTNLSKKPFFIMGCLDAIGAAMQVLATVYLPGTLLVLIPQAAIPLSMCAGSLILRERYTVHQYVGAMVVFCGILVVLFPIFTHKHEADHYCRAKDLENDCILCEMEMTQEDCLSHLRTGDNDPTKDGGHEEPWLVLPTSMVTTAVASLANNHTDNDDELRYCMWVASDESVKHEDWLVFVWSIVMLISCIPSVMSTIYKQVALQAPLDPIFVNGWVALFQFVCGLFLVVPSGLVSSPKVRPLEMGKNWKNAVECLFLQTNSINSGCHPDECFHAALWVHLSLVNSAIYALAMIFVLKYGGADLMYLGLTLVVPLGHLAFSLHSSFSTTTAYDVLGLVVLVAGLLLYRFGYSKEQSSPVRDNRREHRYEPVGADDTEENSGGNQSAIDLSRQVSMATDNDKSGFLEFLREPFMLVGDI